MCHQCLRTLSSNVQSKVTTKFFSLPCGTFGNHNIVEIILQPNARGFSLTGVTESASTEDEAQHAGIARHSVSACYVVVVE